ncbi:MAG TPA: hypothetical protein VN602_00375 [Gemmatimonadaceae bacterium]|nr:hypothetical protein [Gemmatimonadaceae bacterium]
MCSVPFVAVLALLHHAYKRSIPFRKPTTEIPELLQRRSLWVFNFRSYQVAGYDLVVRMRLLLAVLVVAWAILLVGVAA